MKPKTSTTGQLRPNSITLSLWHADRSEAGRRLASSC